MFFYSLKGTEGGQACCSHAAIHRLALCPIIESGKYTGLPEVTKGIVTEIRLLYPDALEMALDGTHPVHAVGDSLPFPHSYGPNRTFGFEMCDGPLDLVGMHLPFECECGTSGSVTTLNARFIALTHHIFKAAMSDEPQSAYAIEQVWRAFRDGRQAYTTLKAPDCGLWSERKTHGMAWLFFHELAHYALPRPLPMPIPDNAFVKPEEARKELEADVASFHHLTFRLRAQNPLSIAEHAELCFGIDGILQVAEILTAISACRNPRRNKSKPNDGAFCPSVHLRREALRQSQEYWAKIGLLPSDIIPNSEAFLARIEKVMSVIV